MIGKLKKIYHNIRIKNQEVLDFFDEYKYDVDISKVCVNVDGTFTYNGSISLIYKDFVEVPKVFLYFTKINGNLDFSNCYKLRNIENLRNLRYIECLLNFYECRNLESLHGLENLEVAKFGINIFKTTASLFYLGNPTINEKYFGLDYGIFRIHPPERHQEFEEYVESEKTKKVFNFVK